MEEIWKPFSIQTLAVHNSWIIVRKVIPLWDLLSSRWKPIQPDNKKNIVRMTCDARRVLQQSCRYNQVNRPFFLFLFPRNTATTLRANKYQQKLFLGEPQTGAEWVNKTASGGWSARILCPGGRQFAKSFIMSRCGDAEGAQRCCFSFFSPFK